MATKLYRFVVVARLDRKQLFSYRKTPENRVIAVASFNRCGANCLSHAFAVTVDDNAPRFVAFNSPFEGLCFLVLVRVRVAFETIPNCYLQFF